MKIFIKNKVFFILTAIIPLLTVTCADTTDDKVKEASAFLGDSLIITGEQVWVPNYNTGKISQMLSKFDGNRDVDVIVIEYTNDSQNFNIQEVGTGKVEKGKLSFNVNKLAESNLLESDDLVLHYINEWYDNNGNITVNPPTVKGNLISLVTQYDNDSSIPSEGIIKEGFHGTRTSLTGEYIYYIYVDDACTISAGKVVKTELQYTFNKFTLSLKPGWNTILKSETYTTTGDSSYSITVSNPEIRWLMQDIK